MWSQWYRVSAAPNRLRTCRKQVSRTTPYNILGRGTIRHFNDQAYFMCIYFIFRVLILLSAMSQQCKTALSVLSAVPLFSRDLLDVRRQWAVRLGRSLCTEKANKIIILTICCKSQGRVNGDPVLIFARSPAVLTNCSQLSLTTTHKYLNKPETRPRPLPIRRYLVWAAHSVVIQTTDLYGHQTKGQGLLFYYYMLTEVKEQKMVVVEMFVDSRIIFL